jgi:hypothetical protein
VNPQIGILIDHAAALQREVERLNEEILTLALACLALALALMMMGVKLWHDT